MRRLALVVVLALLVPSVASARHAAGVPVTWHVPVLTYHRIMCAPPDAEDPSLYVCPDLFREQIEAVLEDGWTFITANKLAYKFSINAHPYAKRLVLSLDDNALDHMLAATILDELGVNATFFVITDRLDQPFNLTWADMLTLQSHGHDVENHTANHQRLPDLDGPALAYEIRQPQQAILDHLGYTPNAIAYPYGRYDAEVKQVARTTPGLVLGFADNRQVCESFASPFSACRLVVDGDWTPADLLTAIAPYANG